MDSCDTDEMVMAGTTLMVSDDLRAVMIAVYVICIVSLVVNAAVFLYFKQRYARIKVRSTLLMYLYCAAAFVFPTGFILPLIIGLDRFPCWLAFALSALCLCFFTAVSFMRNSNFVLMTKLSMTLYMYGRIPIDEIAAAEEHLARLKLHERIRENLSLIYFGLRLSFQTDGVTTTSTRTEHIRTLVCLRYITSSWGFLAFFFVIFMPYFILVLSVCLSVPAFAQGCHGCLPDNLVTIHTLLAMGAVLLANAIFFALKCRSLPDVWGVFHEGRLSALGIVISFLGFVLVAFANNPNRYYFNVVSVLGFPIGFVLVTSYQVVLARTNEVTPMHDLMIEHRSKRITSKATISSIASTGDSSNQFATANTPLADAKSCPRLNEIVSSTALLRAFEFHLSTEFGGENLSFLLDTHEWKLAFNDVARSASLARARKIIGTYVRENGLNQINVSSEMRLELLQAITGEANGLQRTLFDRARTEIANLLETGAVMRFVQTRVYSDHVSGDTVTHDVA